MSRARALGYRLLGPRFDYLLHLRPAEWPIVSVHFLTGSALAVGLPGLGGQLRRGPLLLALLAWVIGLNGGTLALNSAFDRDEGDVAYLRAPPPPPRRLAAASLGLMTAGLGAAFLLPAGFAAAYAVCFALSIVYSVPPARAKAVPGLDWAINMAGFGFLTPFAGYAATGLRPTGPHLGVLLAFALLFGALYPLTQLYQLDEDALRGDRTLAIALGARRSLLLAAAMAAAAFGLLFWTAAGSRWWGGAERGLRAAGLALAGAAWGAVIGTWLARLGRLTPRDHQHRMYVALAAWAVTDAAVLAAWGR